MENANSFCQPMEYTGLPNTGNWAGYEYLQWTGDVFHPGIDYNWGAGEQDKGKPIFAIANGIVEKTIKWDGKTKGFGNHILIKHILGFDYELNGRQFKKGDILYSHYCHLDTIDCKEGQEVSKGDKIGTCGGSGGWPSHLHIELRKALGYDFWPIGYTAEWIKERYFDVYQFVEDNKGDNMSDDLKECLKLHTQLVNECTQKDKQIKKLEDNLRKKNEDLEKANENTVACNNLLKDLEKEVENMPETDCEEKVKLALKNNEEKHKIELDKLNGVITDLENNQQSINKLQEKITELENSQEYKIGEALVKVFNKITFKRS